MATTKKNASAKAKAKQTTTKRPKTWADVSGRMRVWGKEVEYKKSSFMSYSTSVGAKNADGEYDNIYYNVRFRKDEHPDRDGVFEINVKSGFLTVTTDKKGNCYPAVMVLDYEVIDEDEDSDEYDEDELPY
jgi:hypothetical protein